MSVPDHPTLDALANVLEAGLKEAAESARDQHWMLRIMQVVQHRAWTDGPPRASYKEEMVADFGAIGRYAEFLKRTCSDGLTPILESDQQLAGAFATSDYEDDVEQVIRIAAAVDALVDDFVVLYLRDSHNFDWNEIAFERAMNAVRKYAGLQSHSLVVRAPLLGLTMNSDGLKISDGICIKPLREEEFLRLQDSNLYERQNRTMSPFQWAPGRFVLEMLVDVPIGADRYDERRAIVWRLHECLTAVRLLGDGFVYMGDIWFERTTPSFGDTYEEVYVSDGWRGVKPGLKLDVEESTAGVVAQLLSQLVGVFTTGSKKSHPLHVPNSRFNMYFERDLVEDQLLDLAICLEALFTKPGEKTEVTYRISRRIGRLLGTTQPERVTMIKTAKDIYDVRSRLVHGTYVDPQELFENVQELIRIVRAAILLKIQTGWTVDSLDDRMMI